MSPSHWQTMSFCECFGTSLQCFMIMEPFLVVYKRKKKVLNLLIAFEVSTVLAAALGALLHLTCGEAQH